MRSFSSRTCSRIAGHYDAPVCMGWHSRHHPCAGGLRADCYISVGQEHTRFICIKVAEYTKLASKMQDTAAFRRQGAVLLCQRARAGPREPDATLADFEPFRSHGERGGLRHGRRRLLLLCPLRAARAGGDTGCLSPVSPTAERRRKAPGARRPVPRAGRFSSGSALPIETCVASRVGGADYERARIL